MLIRRQMHTLADQAATELFQSSHPYGPSPSSYWHHILWGDEGVFYKTLLSNENYEEELYGQAAMEGHSRRQEI